MKRSLWCAAMALVIGSASASSLLLDDVVYDTLYQYPPGIILKDGAEYDYVVVGAGAAGAAAASRLALKGFSVVLIEAGGDPDALSKIPMAAMGLLGSPIDWQYKTISNNVSCLSFQGKQCRFARGKCLGGSTSINYMLYTRGNRLDYDEMNIPGWRWKDLKPYFLRYEGLQIAKNYPPSSRIYHNTSGILKIEYFDDPRNPWQFRLVTGMKDLNVPFNKDLNGKNQIGVSKVAGYVYKGERMSTARAYLSRDDVKKALNVAKNAFCTGVIIDDNNVARGVTVIQGLLNVTVLARKEVILSAGAVGTPQILMLSGIGPDYHLKSLGIKVRKNLTVGDDMSDHVLPLIIVKVDKGHSIPQKLSPLIGRAAQLGQFLVAGDGPLASNGITDIVTLMNSDCYDYKNRKLYNNSTKCEYADLQIIAAYVDRSLVTVAKPLFKHAIGLNDDVVEQISKANEDYALIILSPVVLKPYSRGNIRLASADPTEQPAIFANYLGDSRDVDQMLKHIIVLEHLVEAPTFKKQNASILHLNLPECPSYEKSRVKYWRCYARSMTYAVYHAVGTCALQRVVNEKLQVYGVKNLRVADLSVMKKLVRGNTEAVSVAIGERLVDLIVDDLNKKTKCCPRAK
ncbi:glucose dehydrogenase [FAD, quinone]-like isoform X1 [Bombyx mandarina]|nr:glucose dehydrogenase [FAD, quinone]-like isoform X1 [Bombyx mandarina]